MSATAGPEIKGWFSTPVATARNPEADTLNPRLRALFLEREAEPYRHHLKIPTQIGAVFESRFDLFDWPDEPVVELADFIHESLSSVVSAINGYSAEELDGFEFFYDSWFHITRNGGYRSSHFHPNASWSGIYCVDAGEAVDERPESGQVKFYDPRGPAAHMHFDAGNRSLDPRLSTTPIYLTHSTGHLVIFPSWLIHEVLPYLGRRERIVVAFNAWMEDSVPE